MKRNYRRKTNDGVPIWIWCVGILSAYFMLFDRKIMVVNETPGIAGRMWDSDTGQDLRAELKSKY